MGNKKQIEESLKSLILNDNRPFVAMLSGEWGVGKTYFWKEFTTNHLRGKDVVYISLFGQNSLADIETTIVTKLYKYNKTLKKYSKHLDTVSSMTSKALHLPINVSAGSILSLFSPGDFKNIVICFDDFERLSDKVPLKDVMGLISQFKEQKECKVVMILNEGELNKLSDIDGKKHDEVFALYKEKVVDYGFHYAPNHEEVFEAIKEDVKKIIFADHETIYQFFRETGLFNIRIMKQALYLLEYFKFIKDKEYDKKVVDEFVKIALNLFVFKLKSNYSYNEFQKHIKNSLYIPDELMAYSTGDDKDSEIENNGKDEKEIKRHSENAKYYHGIQDSHELPSPSQDKIEDILYKFLDKFTVEQSSLETLLFENNLLVWAYDTRDELARLNEQLLNDYSTKLEDVVKRIAYILNYHSQIISDVIDYDAYKYYINIVKSLAPSELNIDTETKCIKNYITKFIHKKEGINNPLQQIKKDYDLTDKYIEDLMIKDLEMFLSIENLIILLKYIIETGSISIYDMYIFRTVTKDKYLAHIKASSEFAKNIEYFIDHVRDFPNLAERVQPILITMIEALDDLREQGNAEKWRIEKLEKRLGIDIKKELKRLKMESRKYVDET